MPTYANPLYANGVPTYSNEIGALADVFKALAPNPLRDLQIQGYANNARLSQLRGDVIQNQQGGLSDMAAALQTGNYGGVLPAAMRSGNLQYLGQIGKAVPAQYSMSALDPSQPWTADNESRLASVVGATGGNVANTLHGFTANQDRQTAEANQKNDTERYEIGVQSADRRYGTDVGASTARRGQDIGAESATYRTNLNYLKPSGRTGTGAGGGGGTTGGGAAASDLNPKMIGELDSALAEVMQGVDARVAPEDRADVRARVQADFLSQPKGGRNPQLSANRVLQQIAENPNLAESTKSTWMGLGDDQLRLKKLEQRGALPQPWQPPPKVAVGGGGAGGLSPLSQTILQGNPNLSKKLTAAQLSAAAPAAPAAAPAAAPTANPLLAEAAAAIASGAPKEAVIQRLRSMGVPDEQLQGL